MSLLNISFYKKSFAWRFINHFFASFILLILLFWKFDKKIYDSLLPKDKCQYPTIPKDNYQIIDFGNVSEYSKKYRLLQHWSESRPLNREGKRAIIFVPGHGGSYRQVRFIAETLYEKSDIFDVYTIDNNEEFTAFHGPSLRTQSGFLSESLQFLLHLKSYQSPLVLIGHSMGAMVIEIFLHEIKRNNLNLNIDALYFASTHLKPIYPIEPELRTIFDLSLHDNPQPGINKTSILAGIRDRMVPAEFGNDMRINNVWISSVLQNSYPDHDDILVCKDITNLVTDSLIDAQSLSSPNNLHDENVKGVCHLSIPELLSFEFSQYKNCSSLQMGLIKSIFPYGSFKLKLSHGTADVEAIEINTREKLTFFNVCTSLLRFNSEFSEFNLTMKLSQMKDIKDDKLELRFEMDIISSVVQFTRRNFVTLIVGVISISLYMLFENYLFARNIHPTQPELYLMLSIIGILHCILQRFSLIKAFLLVTLLYCSVPLFWILYFVTRFCSTASRRINVNLQIPKPLLYILLFLLIWLPYPISLILIMIHYFFTIGKVQDSIHPDHKQAYTILGTTIVIFTVVQGPIIFQILKNWSVGWFNLDDSYPLMISPLAILNESIKMGYFSIGACHDFGKRYRGMLHIVLAFLLYIGFYLGVRCIFYSIQIVTGIIIVLLMMALGSSNREEYLQPPL